VDRLILVDAAGYPFKSASVPLGFRIARIPGINRLMEYTLPYALVRSSVRNVYGDPTKVTPELVDRYFELTLREGNRHALGQRFAQLNFQGYEKIKSIKLPTLILWGGQDRLIPPENAVAFQRDIAGSQVVMFETLGHVPHEEDPVATVDAVHRFLQKS
jgi:pimeloyl-ACP methyl ester carboxylesterase